MFLKFFGKFCNKSGNFLHYCYESKIFERRIFMKKIFTLFLIIALLCGCSPAGEEQQIPDIPENPVSENEENEPENEQESKPEEEQKTEPEKTGEITEYADVLGLFGATDLGHVQLIHDNTAFVLSYNRDIDEGDGFKTMISRYSLETGEAENLFEGSAYMEYSNMLYAQNLDLIGESAFTGKQFFTGEETYNLGGRPNECDFCFANQSFVRVDENDKTKLYIKNLPSGEEKLIYEISGEDSRFLAAPQISPSGEYIVIFECEYTISHLEKIICIDYEGNLVFEKEIGESVYSETARWLSDENFAVFFHNGDEIPSEIKMFDVSGNETANIKLDFVFDKIQNDMFKSYPYAIVSRINNNHFSESIMLINFENGFVKELYTSGRDGIIRGMDLSPSGKTLCWIENDGIMKMNIG